MSVTFFFLFFTSVVCQEGQGERKKKKQRKKAEMPPGTNKELSCQLHARFSPPGMRHFACPALPS